MYTALLSVILHLLFCVSPLPATIGKGHQQHLLREAWGSVGEGNYSYFTVGFEGPLTILLRSKLGDADLYVSSYDLIPTWEPHSYSLQSSTCGDDVVFVPSDLRRPLHVAVYGHPSHALSKFSLHLYCYHQAPEGVALGEASNTDYIAAKGSAVCRPANSFSCSRSYEASPEPQDVFPGAREAGLEWLGTSIIWMPIIELLSLFLLKHRTNPS